MLDKLKTSIEEYKKLWKEPDFRLLQQFNWIQIAMEIVRSSLLFACLLTMTMGMTNIYQELKGMMLDYREFSEIGVQEGTADMTLFALCSLIMIPYLFFVGTRIAKSIPDNREADVSYAIHSLIIKEKGNGRAPFIFFNYVQLVAFGLFSPSIIQVRPTGDLGRFLGSFEDFMQVFIGVGVLCCLFGLCIALKSFKLKKFAETLTSESYVVLTTEKESVELINELGSFLPGRWASFSKKESIVFNQFIKNQQFERENEVGREAILVTDPKNTLEITYKFRYTSLFATYKINVVFFETEKELRRYGAFLNSNKSAPIEIKVILNAEELAEAHFAQLGSEDDQIGEGT